MIDEAEAANNKKQNEGIGLVNAKEDEDEGRLGERDNDRLEEMIRAKKPARVHEEERKGAAAENAEDFDTLLRNDSLSARSKIEKMGLGRALSSPDKMPVQSKTITEGRADER